MIRGASWKFLITPVHPLRSIVGMLPLTSAGGGMSGFRLVSEEGSGRSYIILREKGSYEATADLLGAALSSKAFVQSIETDRLTDHNWRELSDKLLAFLRERNHRQTSLLGLGPAGSLAQDLCLREGRLVRNMVLVDPSGRPHPTFVSRVIDRIESKLPIALPFRTTGEGFDVRPFAHRLRCPLLIVLTPRSSPYLKAQAREIALISPNAWLLEVGGDTEVARMAEAVEAFQDVPARCPQKRKTVG